MGQTYLFSKKTRDKAYEEDTSYCFRLRTGNGWLHLNRKATKLIEHEDHYEVILADWYINIGDKFISQTLKRQNDCKDLQDYYYFLKNIENDKGRENK
jgi:hypothetical protein